MSSDNEAADPADGDRAGMDNDPDPGFENAMNLIGGQRDKLQDLIVTLRGERERIKESKKILAKQLKSAQRKKQRLKKKAKELSSADIIDVLIMRKTAQAVAKAKPTKKKSATSTPTST